MAKLIAKNGRLQTLGGKLITDADGAPCCCGDVVEPCNVFNGFYLDIESFAIDLQTESITGVNLPQGTVDLVRTSRVNLSFPTSRIAFNGTQYFRPGVTTGDYRIWQTSCGAFVNHDEEFPFVLSGGWSFTQTQDGTTTATEAEAVGILENILITASFIDNGDGIEFFIKNMLIVYNTCNPANGELTRRTVDLYFEDDGGGAPASDWESIETTGTIPMGCSQLGLSVNQGSLSGRAYTLPTQGGSQVLSPLASHTPMTDVLLNQSSGVVYSGFVDRTTTHHDPSVFSIPPNESHVSMMTMELIASIAERDFGVGTDLCGETPPHDCTDGTGQALNTPGLGDLAKSAIDFVTLGKVKQCPGCKKRQEAMNRLSRRLLNHDDE